MIIMLLYLAGFCICSDDPLAKIRANKGFALAFLIVVASEAIINFTLAFILFADPEKPITSSFAPNAWAYIGWGCGWGVWATYGFICLWSYAKIEEWKEKVLTTRWQPMNFSGDLNQLP